ncbi:MAG: anion permease [Chloroflexi bacterium]|nr:anion permease [Chloroflexota bacterium]
MARKGREDRVLVDMARLDTASRPLLVDYSGLGVHKPLSDRLVGRPGYRPFLLVVVAALFIGVALLPVPGSLVDMMSVVNPPGYRLAPGTKTIVDSVNYSSGSEAFEAVEEDGRPAVDAQDLASAEQVARRAMIMLGILFAAAMLWGTEALPIGGTVIVVAVLMFLFGVLPTDEVPNAFVNDAVFFIIGILAVAVGVSKTGLDRRIGLILLSHIKSASAFAFIFFPILAVLAGFLSEHALVAFLVPVMMGIYRTTCDVNGVKQDRVLAIFLLLGICFTANVGGPASPAAGARNAIMVGYFADAGVPISFAEWMKYGMPLVPVLALTVGAYMYLRCKPKMLVKDFNPSEAVKREVAKLPRFGGQEAIMAVILGALIIAWITLYDTFGLGGATLAAVSAMFLLGIIRWSDVQRGVAFDVVGLYAAASAIAVGLSVTGGGLWLANEVVGVLPPFLSEGTGLVMGVSIVTGILTNFMSDGATVGVLGPIALPMAELGDVSLWKVGLIVSFASSFANVLIVGTPNNAIAFAMSKDPETGKRLLSVFDFVRYGLPLTILLMLVMWVWALFGYWSILSWP